MRLRILASSNSEEDQKIKLEVKEIVYNYLKTNNKLNGNNIDIEDLESYLNQQFKNNDIKVTHEKVKYEAKAYEEKIRKLNSGNYAELEGYDLYVYSEEVIDSWMIPKLIQAVNSINVGVKKYRYIYFVTLCEILVFDTEHDECAGIDIAGGRKLDGLGEKARKIVEAGEKR